jgi:hypothetical protein
MDLPIGCIVDNATAIQLCHQFGLNHLVGRIAHHPTRYRSWIFDGVSGFPDWIFRFLGDQWRVTHLCALPHDLRYAYGEPGNREERRLADRLFYHDLVDKGRVRPLVAGCAYVIVRLLGHQQLGWSCTWAFADSRISSYSSRPLPWTF